MRKSNPRHLTFFNARLTSIISIALVLFILGLISLLSIVATELALHVKENIGFSVVLDEKVDDAQMKSLQTRIARQRYVKEVECITKEDALKVLIDELGENPEEFLGFNPLSASMEVRLKADYANTDSVAWIEKELMQYKGIREVAYQKDLIHLVNDNMRRIGGLLLGLAVILMVISFALISNTVRLSAYSKRFLIHTMKLVGASPSFIRKPFLRDALVNGIIGAVIAIGMLSGCLYYLATEMDTMRGMVSWMTLGMVFAIVLVLGVVLTIISAYFAVNRYIRMKQDTLYYI